MKRPMCHLHLARDASGSLEERLEECLWLERVPLDDVTGFVPASSVIEDRNTESVKDGFCYNEENLLANYVVVRGQIRMGWGLLA